MKPSPFNNPSFVAWANLLVLAVFVLLTYGQYSGDQGLGDDLSSSYVGCVVMNQGEALGHLYAHDPSDFAVLGPDEAWRRAAAQGGFAGFLHPYVQTPLWAYLCRPLCARTSFAAFKDVFVALELLCFAVTIWLVARHWTPFLCNPWALAAACFLLAMSQPFQYAMYLLQSHVIFYCLTIAGLILAEKRRPGVAGALVAFAAAVKITPVLVLVYWLAARKRKAAACLAAWSALFLALTVLTTGLPLFRLYLADLSRVGQVLLLSRNNQSFAAWWMSHFYPSDEVSKFTVHRLPRLLQAACAALSLGFALLGGLLDRRRRAFAEPGRLEALPLGAMVALLAATIFAPIAWTHYSIVLIAPLMLLVQANVRLRSWPLAVTILAVVSLNFQPLAPTLANGTIGTLALVRGQLLAGVLCMVALIWLALGRLKGGPPRSVLSDS